MLNKFLLKKSFLLDHIDHKKLKKSIISRNYDLNILKDCLKKYKLYKNKKKELEQLRYESKQLALNKNKTEGKKVKIMINDLNNILSDLKIKILLEEIHLPNLLHNKVPYGKSELDNVEIERYGEPKTYFNHKDIEYYKLINVTGTGFVVLENELAILERALGNFFLDFLKSKGFNEISLPHVVQDTGMYNSRHLADKENMFQVENDSYLIPTGETVLVNYVQNPGFYCSLTDCFRKEAAANGNKDKGLIRVHQFKKCEMVCAVNPKDSMKTLKKMINIVKQILKKLKLPYRVLLLCSADTSHSSYITYDIEVPIKNNENNGWREISSISNCTNIQSINMNKKHNEEYLHLLNGSSLPLGRTLAAILENHYKNGVIYIPKCLHKYTKFTTLTIK